MTYYDKIKTNYNEINIKKLNELKLSLNPILEEFKKLFVLSKMYPQNQEIQNQYQNIINNINEIKTKFFTFSNEIDVNIDELNKKLLALNTLIIKERKTNEKLKLKMGYVESKNNAANELINDYEFIYNKNYLKNWAIILSSLIALYIISIVYKQSKK